MERISTQKETRELRIGTPTMICPLATASRTGTALFRENCVGLEWENPEAVEAEILRKK